MRGSRLSVLVLVLGIGLMGARPSWPGSLAPSKASDAVVLTRGQNACPGVPGGGILDQAIRPDGTLEAFSVPQKRVLVLTGFTVGHNGASGAIAGDTVSVALTVGTLFVAYLTAVADAADTVSFHATFPSGVVVQSQTPVCIVFRNETDSGALEIGFNTAVYGYLAKDK